MTATVIRDMRSEKKYLDEHHISLVWNLLHEKFGFDTKEWKRRFMKFHEEQKNGPLITDSFYRFGNKFIEPVLNAILCRQELHPTFTKVVDYVINK